MHVGHTVPFEFTKYDNLHSVCLGNYNANVYRRIGGCKTFSMFPSSS
jgi:hypothetical protein